MKSRVFFIIIISILLVALTSCGKTNRSFIDNMDFTTTTEDNMTDSTENPTSTPEDMELSQNTEASMVKKSHEGLNYWLYTPSNAKENMPLIIYLHGGSGKGDDLELITSIDGLPQYIKKGTLSADAYIVFPQCPSTQNGWNALTAKIEELIYYTCNEFSIDTNKISITGHSMGGAGTWTLALSNPDLFYKIAPMSGSVIINDTDIEKLFSLSVWAFVGENERSTTIDNTKAIIDILKSLGADAQITILEGATHFEVPSVGYLDKTLNIIEWLIE